MNICVGYVVEWATWGTWVAALGTVSAAYGTIRAFAVTRRQLAFAEQQRREDLDRAAAVAERSQAELVNFWVEGNEAYHGIGALHAQNASGQPIFDVRIAYVSSHRGDRTGSATMFPPGFSKQLVPGYIKIKSVVVTFADSRGVYWRRSWPGKLDKLSVPPAPPPTKKTLANDGSDPCVPLCVDINVRDETGPAIVVEAHFATPTDGSPTCDASNLDVHLALPTPQTTTDIDCDGYADSWSLPTWDCFSGQPSPDWSGQVAGSPDWAEQPHGSAIQLPLVATTDVAMLTPPNATDKNTRLDAGVRYAPDSPCQEQQVIFAVTLYGTPVLTDSATLQPGDFWHVGSVDWARQRAEPCTQIEPACNAVPNGSVADPAICAAACVHGNESVGACITHAWP